MNPPTKKQEFQRYRLFFYRGVLYRTRGLLQSLIHKYDISDFLTQTELVSLGGIIRSLTGLIEALDENTEKLKKGGE